MKEFSGTLQFDHERGVIYFHLTNEKDIEKLGVLTLLRICNLPKLKKYKKQLYDITHLKGCNWESDYD